MTREEAIKRLKGILAEVVEFENSVCYVTNEDREPLEMAIKALERESKKYTRPRYCDCCGVLLTEDNNKCGYELCDECNERLEQSMERGRNDQRRSTKPFE